MIVDAARDPRIFWLLREYHLERYCLYSGPLPAELEAAAPYLIQLECEDEDTRHFLRKAWSNSWGVFIKCAAHANALRRHLRGFLVARDADGKRMLFRYYDPRVLRIYLPSCVEKELESFFGPIECFWTEGKAAYNMLEFRLSRGTLMQRTLSLEADAPVQGLIPGALQNDAARSDIHSSQGLITIRREQMGAFSRAEVERFEAWMLKHLLTFFPKQCRLLQETQLRELIQYGIERARGHRITAERDVAKFIDLMLVFGRDFDTNKQYGWAGAILARRMTARMKVRALHEAASKHIGTPDLIPLRTGRSALAKREQAVN